MPSACAICPAHPTEADLPRGIDDGDMREEVLAIRSTWGDKQPGSAGAAAKPVPAGKGEVEEEESMGRGDSDYDADNADDDD